MLILRIRLIRRISWRQFLLNAGVVFTLSAMLSILGTLGVPGQGRSGSSPGLPAALAEARQLVLVVARDWDSLQARLQKFERSSAGAPWHRMGPAFGVVVGRSGLAWGLGLHGESPGSGPLKKEGDGRSPAGLFRLSGAFGYDAAPQRMKLPFLELLGTTECVDDPKSKSYNLIVDRSKVAAPDWASSEKMRRSDEFYRQGAFIDHNAGSPVSGKGSCIFLHIWGGPSNGTAGCTAMDARKLEELLLWLDPQARPVLVQLPEVECLRLRGLWKLPS